MPTPKTKSKRAQPKVAKKSAKKVPKKVAAKPKRKSAARPKLAGPRPKRPKKIDLPDLNALNIQQVAAVLSAYFASYGYEPVLTGRAVAAIYAGAGVKPRTLDFAAPEYEVDEVGKAMKRIGFKEGAFRTFRSDICPYEIVFTPFPVTIGENIVEDFHIMRTAEGPLKMLTPTDCVRQMLARYYRWGDRDGMHEARLVARKHTIDYEMVKRWSEWEWAGDRYDEFLEGIEA